MKKLLVFLLLCSFCISAFPIQSVHGYRKKNGTYVAPYHRTSPNKTQRDNWSSKGNVNPYTGKIGTKVPVK